MISRRGDLKELTKPLDEVSILYQKARQQFERNNIKRGKSLLQAAKETIENPHLVKLLRRADSLFYEKEAYLKDKIHSALLKEGVQLQDGKTLEKIDLTRKESVRWGWRPLSSIKSIVLHHTDNFTLKQIHSKHTSHGYLDKKGAPFIAYHFLILENGTILWLNHLQDRVWHARDANFHTIGVALHGNLVDTSPTRKQIESLKALTKALKTSLGLEKLPLIGHGELTEYGNDTECPGKHGRQLVKFISKHN